MGGAFRSRAPFRIFASLRLKQVMLNPNEKIEPINVAEEVSRSFLDYSMSVIISRALRYSDARMSHLGAAVMADMEKDTVDFVPNYDETRTEPTVFPAAFPNLLVNGGTGIAVGMATNIPPHNLSEVIDGVCAQIDNPEITLEELMKHVKGPDFPTGCVICGVSGIKQYLETGRGSMKVRG